MVTFLFEITDSTRKAPAKEKNKMSFTFIQKLPTPEEIREQYPVPAHLAAKKAERDAEIRDVLTGKSDKLLVIIGPCSADNEDAVCDYISRVPPATATRALSISPTPKKRRISCRVLPPCAICTCAPSPNPA